MKNAGLLLQEQPQSLKTCRAFTRTTCSFIVDEASGVADPIMEAILGTLSGANNKLLMCGNPTKTSGIFTILIPVTEGCINATEFLPVTAPEPIRKI